MDFTENNKVSAFDALFCTNHIQMLKILLAYTDNQTQKSLAVYIKFLELQYTLEFYQKHPYPLCGCTNQEQEFDIGKVCNELLPYCTEEERKHLEQIRSIISGMKMYQEMSRTMEMMKEIMPDMDDMGDIGNLFTSNNTTGQMNIMDLLMNMLTPEQKEMFTMLGGMNHDNGLDE